MRTIEDTLQAVYEIGRVAGAAETLKDEQTRDCIFGSAQAVHDGLLEEAIEDDEHLRAAISGSFWNIWKGTRFEKFTKSPEALARCLVANAEECPRGLCSFENGTDPSTEDCVRCITEWLQEEVTDDEVS